MHQPPYNGNPFGPMQPIGSANPMEIHERQRQHQMARAAAAVLSDKPMAACQTVRPRGPLATELEELKHKSIGIHERISLLESRLAFVLGPTPPSDPNALAKPIQDVPALCAIDEVKDQLNGVEVRILGILDRLAV